MVPLSDVTIDSLREQAKQIALFLLEHPGEGVYQPVNDAMLEPGTPASRALVVIALQRSLKELDLDWVREDRIEATVEEELEALRSVIVESPAELALILVALDASTDEPDESLGELVDRIAAIDDEQIESNRTRSAVIAWALAELGRDDAAAAMVSRLRRVDHPGQLVGVMPWLGWAEVSLAREGGPVPSAVALRQMRDLVYGFQLRSSDAGVEDRDLVGGVVFTSGAVPLPTWQSVRPLAFMATMLGDARLTEDDEIGPEVVHLARGLRFLLQLSASETESHLYRKPQRAIGGVRAAVWDQSMPIEASALTLLTLLEAIKSLEAAGAREAQSVPSDRSEPVGSP